MSTQLSAVPTSTQPATASATSTNRVTVAEATAKQEETKKDTNTKEASTTTKNIHITSYMYKCELAFNCSDKTTYSIDQSAVTMINIIHNYDKAFMPIMYLTINIDPTIYHKLVKDQKKGKIYIRLYGILIESSTVTTVEKPVLNTELDYMITDEPDTQAQMEQVGNVVNGSNQQINYRKCILGLYKNEFVKQNTSVHFEGHYTGNVAGFISKAMSGLKNVIIQPFVNNTTFDKKAPLSCPSCTSITQFLSFINNRASFYKGAFLFYMDFDGKVYLRSNDGTSLDVKDGHYPIVAVHIEEITPAGDPEMQKLALQIFNTGMISSDTLKAYIIYISGSDGHAFVNRNKTELMNNIEQIDPATGETKKTAVSQDVSKTTNVEASNATSMVISQDPNASTNAMTQANENLISVTISKVDLLSSVFTPAREYQLCYYLNTEAVNQKYIGHYYLAYKNEVYIPVGDHLKCLINMTLKKCAS